MKKTANYLIALLMLVLIQACTATVEEQRQAETKVPTIFGHYTYGHEVNSFRPCGEKQDFWVKGSNDTLELMTQKYSALVTKLYDEVFVEIKGNFESKASDGFAMDYDGQVNILELVHMKNKHASDCE
ncbi:hypothetical protein [Moritella dasanensis]|uniref:hypothetical protein n=1 Tax=Moritella dasanensis TaxID=428031 RepID=UPI0002D8540C|nr:hypothetical protein [Moritella dasanensis]